MTAAGEGPGASGRGPLTVVSWLDWKLGARLLLKYPRHVLRSVFARAGRQLGGGIIAGNSLILLLAWRADSLTVDLLVSSVITSVIMAAVGVLACAAPARRALRIQPTEALRLG